VCDLKFMATAECGCAVALECRVCRPVAVTT